MKKIVLVAVLATSAAMAAPFNGFSIGGNLGAALTTYKFKPTDAGKLAGFVDESVSKTNLLMNMFVGYTKSFGNMFAGVDFGLGIDRGGKIETKKNNGFGYENLNALVTSFSPRIGYKFNDTTAAYGKVSLAYNSYNVSKGVDLDNKNWSTTLLMGVEKFVNENVSLQGEVGYKFQTLKFKKDSTSSVILKNIKKNAVVMTIGASYSF